MISSLCSSTLYYRFYIQPGPWSNINMSSYQYRDPHCGDKTIVTTMEFPTLVRHLYIESGLSPSLLLLIPRGSTEDKTRTADVRLSSNGDIFWLLHRYYNSACLINIRDYPFDQQTCHLWFQSLSNPSHTMDIQPYSPGFDLDTYLSDFQVRHCFRLYIFCHANRWWFIINDTQMHRTLLSHNPGISISENTINVIVSNVGAFCNRDPWSIFYFILICIYGHFGTK